MILIVSSITVSLSERLAQTFAVGDNVKVAPAVVNGFVVVFVEELVFRINKETTLVVDGSALISTGVEMLTM